MVSTPSNFVVDSQLPTSSRPLAKRFCVWASSIALNPRSPARSARALRVSRPL